jgi:hypothetical protein
MVAVEADSTHRKPITASWQKKHNTTGNTAQRGGTEEYYSQHKSNNSAHSQQFSFHILTRFAVNQSTLVVLLHVLTTISRCNQSSALLVSFHILTTTPRQSVVGFGGEEPSVEFRPGGRRRLGRGGGRRGELCRTARRSRAVVSAQP